PELTEAGANEEAIINFKPSAISYKPSAIQIFVDPDNVIREYNEENNEYKKEMYLPKTPLIESLQSLINQKYIDISGTADPYTKVKIYRNSEEVGIVYTDGEGKFEYRIELVAGAKHYITSCAEEFREKLRSREYNIYIINENQNTDLCNKYEGKCSEHWGKIIFELSEAVYRGDGVVFIKTKPGLFFPYPYRDLFGVKPVGYSSAKDWQFNITDTTWHEAMEMNINSGIFKVQPLTAKVRAVVRSSVNARSYRESRSQSLKESKGEDEDDGDDDENDEKEKYEEDEYKVIEDKIIEWPAVVTNSFGKGQAVLFTFNNSQESNETSQESEVRSQEMELMLAALETAAPDEFNFEPFASVPVNTEIKANRACELIVWEDYDNTLELKETNGNIAGSGNIQWHENINDSTDTKLLKNVFKMPDVKGIYETKTTTLFKSRDKWRSYNTTILNLEVKETINEKIDKIITSLLNENTKYSAPAENNKYEKLKKRIVTRLIKIKNSSKDTAEQINKNINKLLKCISILNQIEKKTQNSEEIQKIHLELSNVLAGYEVLWSDKKQEIIPDTTRPFVTYTYPENGAMDIQFETTITAAFSEEMDSTSVNANTIQINVGAGLAPAQIEGTITYNNGAAVFTPLNDLEPNTTYTVRACAKITW
ncbi:Ig-like domain-containing protein, partial [Candidatus Desantisbacteria bacterium]|nr:Ig-like domain-containing protein [Candidatus Desantisbacteria bacterium]